MSKYNFKQQKQMFSPFKMNSPLGSSFDEPVYKNQRKIKNLEANYLNDGYKKSMGSRMSQFEQEKFQKQHEAEAFIKKREELKNDFDETRKNKSMQKSFLANQYDEMINGRKEKQKRMKKDDIEWEKQLLAQPTWVLDEGQQRSINRQKINRYGQELERHIMQQEIRKMNEKEQEQRYKHRVSVESQRIHEKEDKQIQQRYRKKNLFEQRQNELLGIKNNPQRQLSLTSSLDQSRILKRQEQEAYGKGLGQQVNYSQQKKKKQIQHHFDRGQSYNPITNPIPRIYKNPNVIKMFGSS